jgi:hypothetical protein
MAKLGLGLGNPLWVALLGSSSIQGLSAGNLTQRAPEQTELLAAPAPEPTRKPCDCTNSCLQPNDCAKIACCCDACADELGEFLAGLRELRENCLRKANLCITTGLMDDRAKHRAIVYKEIAEELSARIGTIPLDKPKPL